jgi:hypothetical protein
MDLLNVIYVLAFIAGLILAFIGLGQVILWMKGKPFSPTEQPPPTAALQLLTRGEKLTVVKEVLGDRMPRDLETEMRTLMGWQAPPSQIPLSPDYLAALVAPNPASHPIAPPEVVNVPITVLPNQLPEPAPPPFVPPVVVPEPIAAPPGPPPEPLPFFAILPVAPSSVTPKPDTTPAPALQQKVVFDLGEFAAQAGLNAGIATLDDAPLTVPSEVTLAKASSRSRLKLFLSFENIIFLLAACLILGGTLYLVATTWNRVSSRWQQLYAEGLLVFYGWVLLATARFLHRRLSLDAAAGVLAAIAAAMSIGASDLAAAAFNQSILAGIAGSTLTQLLAIPAAGFLIVLHGSPRRIAIFFGIAVLALAITGACLAHEAPVMGAWLAAFAVLSSCGPFLRAIPKPHMTLFLVTIAPAGGVLLLPMSMDVPFVVAAPTLAVLSFACRPARRILPSVFAIPALVALVGLAAGLGNSSLPMLAGIAAIGLLATIDLNSESPHDFLFVFGAGLVVLLAFTWTTIFGFQPWPTTWSDWAWSKEQVARFPIASLGALPFILAAFAVALSTASTRARNAVEKVGYLILVLAAVLTVVPFPDLRLHSCISALALSLIAYANARVVGGKDRLFLAHLLGLGVAFLLGRLGGYEAALAAIGAYALVLIVRRETVGFWIGLVLVPLFASTAIVLEQTRWLPSALFALYGLAILGPRPVKQIAAKALILPALVTAILIALFYAGTDQTAFLPPGRIGLCLLLALGPALLWVAWGRAPLFILVEVLVGIGLAVLDRNAVWALLATTVLLAGRDPRSLPIAGTAFLPLAALAVLQHAFRLPLAAGLALAAGLCHCRRLPDKATFLRWLAIPSYLAAFMVLAFFAPEGSLRLPTDMVVPLAALVLTPFFAWAALRREPIHIVIESAMGLVLVILVGLAWVLGFEHGIWAAVAAGLASLALLFPVSSKVAQVGDSIAFGNLVTFSSWLAIPGFLATLAVMFLGGPVEMVRLPSSLVVPALAIGVLPFFVFALLRKGPEFSVIESVMAVMLLAFAGILYICKGDRVLASAIVTGIASLSLLMVGKAHATLPGPSGALGNLARWLAIPGLVATLASLAQSRAMERLGPASNPVVPLVTLGLAPFFAWAVIRRGPKHIVVESVMGLILVIPAGIGCGLGSDHGLFPAIAASLASLALLFRVAPKVARESDSVSPDTLITFARWLAIPGFLATLAVLARGDMVRLPAGIVVPAIAIGLLPFFVYALIRKHPDFIVIESLVGMVVIMTAGVLYALGAHHGFPSAISAGIASLSLLLVARMHVGLPGQPGTVAAFVRWLAIPGFLVTLATLSQTHEVENLGLPKSSAVPLAALGLAPFFAWAAIRRRPEFVAIESIVAAIVILVAGLGCALFCMEGSSSGITAGVAALALLLPLHAKAFQVRWIALPGFLAAFSILYLHCHADMAWTPAPFFPPAIATVLVPFFLVVLLRSGPRFIAFELLLGTALVACLTLIHGLLVRVGSEPAQAASAATLAALSMFLAIAKNYHPKLARVAWIAIPLLCPVAIIPMTHAMICWPAAIAAMLAVVFLCVQSRRRDDPVMAAIAITTGLLALLWAGAAAGKPFSHGGDPTRHFAKCAIAIAIYGMIMGSLGKRISAASTQFLHRLETATVLIGEAMLLLGIGLRVQPGPGEAISVVLAFATLSCAAVMLAFRTNQGWPFYIAETALGMAYAYLRIRTGWLDRIADLDSLATCIFAFVNLSIAQTLRNWRAGLGAKESQIMATVLPLLAPLFLQIQSPLRAVGSFAAAATYAFMSRQQKRPIFGWLAGILANVGLIPLWLHYEVHSPIAFALPVGATLALLGHVYHERLGKQGPLVRSLASLFVFGATSYQMFQFSSPWPALILALCAILSVLLGIAWRVRAYLYIGFACLLLDIVANLTRWGMGDRLRGALFGLGAGMALLVLGIFVARHKTQLLKRYHNVQKWNW